MTKRKLPAHPMQPIVLASDGVIRFRRNEIVRWLVDTKRLDLNDLARLDFSDDDQMQLMQLLGYSVSGYGDLSCASKKSVRKADRIAERVRKES